jgi:hypothetical protein
MNARDRKEAMVRLYANSLLLEGCGGRAIKLAIAADTTGVLAVADVAKALTSARDTIRAIEADVEALAQHQLEVG